MLLNTASQDKLIKIRESGKFCCLTIKSDFNYVWDISVIEATGTKHDVRYKSGSYEKLDDAVNSLYTQIEALLK